MADLTDILVSTREYSDLSLTMGKNPVTGDVLGVTGNAAVLRAIKSLLKTMEGEVPFFPTYGCNLQRLLFEPVDPITTALIQSEVRAALTAFEPRVKIQQLTVTPTPDAHQYQVQAQLQIVNQANPLTITVFLDRLR